MPNVDQSKIDQIILVMSDRKATIRTVSAVVSAMLPLVSVILQSTVLHYVIKYHPTK